MKKLLIVLIPVAGILMALIVFTHGKVVNLQFAEKITLNYNYGDVVVNMEITDADDFSNLIKICKGIAVNDYSIPACGFGTVELIFEGNGKTVYIYPACDSCNTMRFGKENKYFYDIKDRAGLISILEKYGVKIPCV